MKFPGCVFENEWNYDCSLIIKPLIYPFINRISFIKAEQNGITIIKTGIYHLFIFFIQPMNAGKNMKTIGTILSTPEWLPNSKIINRSNFNNEMRKVIIIPITWITTNFHQVRFFIPH